MARYRLLQRASTGTASTPLRAFYGGELRQRHHLEDDDDGHGIPSATHHHTLEDRLFGDPRSSSNLT
ncbi:hypothetical protein M6B38_185640 [Iris pallida]|uniref:Uncharacterized protein n=1 Tax=Iris pallida TaxID=29817 RepID=A0AAX6EJP2_IRIPA|nr:hypothetical protein M6B38_185640 [Iris pallida]